MLQTKSNGLIHLEGEIRCQHHGLEARSEKRIQYQLTNSAELPKAGPEQQRHVQHVTVRVRLRPRRYSATTQKLRHNPRNLSTAGVAAHRLRTRHPVIAAGALQRLVTLINKHDHRVAVIGFDGLPVQVVRVPRVVGNLADANQVAAKVIAQRLYRPGVARRVGERAIVHLPLDDPILPLRHHAQQLGGAGGGRVLGGKTLNLATGFFPKVAKPGPGEKARSFRHARDLVIYHQRSRLRHPGDAFQRIATQV